MFIELSILWKLVKKNKRKVALFGRSMENMVDVALKCGYFKDKDIVITAEEANHMRA